ncbi:Serine/threonine protein kinase PrkC, regulator of stationary phase [Fimbriiglobus ruber]|uniref:non-specific serine/threonine protein kinase n=2 Tax=Fimbriiglobus ruber TaxID=1908690 RepID=A0A225DV30_9BACT|nr:Serine/threonine protein kinase PrkC, regulator of stationary phase [Fimbriiglobus ruber]
MTKAGLPPDKQADVQDHVDQCEACQVWLDKLFTASSHTTPAVRLDAEGTLPGVGPNHGPATGNLLPSIPGYVLEAEISRGGMGVVYRARQIALNRPVAVKMILSGRLAGVAEVLRFRAEAEAAAGLDHPNILPVYEVGEHRAGHFFSMRLVPGGSLAERTEKPWEPAAAAGLVATLARALHYAHQRGILHRDLKPANVLMDADGTPLVTDFGIAKRLGSEIGHTRTGDAIGTPSYMAPEQARGDKGLTTAVDVYGLGAILYELLTGRPPFKAASEYQTIREVIERDPDTPLAVNRRADPDLSAVAMKCLAKDPGTRYTSAAELAADLDRWLAGEPTHARPPGLVGRTLRWVRRNTGAAVVVVASGVGWGFATGLHISLKNGYQLLIPPTTGLLHPLRLMHAARQYSASWWCADVLSVGFPLAIGWIVRAVVRPRTFQAEWPTASAVGLLALLTFLLIAWPFATVFEIGWERSTMYLHPVRETSTNIQEIRREDIEYLSQFLSPAIRGPDGDRPFVEPNHFESTLAAVVGANAISPIESLSIRDRELRVLHRSALSTNRLHVSFWYGGLFLVVGLVWFLGTGLHGTWVVDTLTRSDRGPITRALCYLEAGPVTWVLVFCAIMVLDGRAIIPLSFTAILAGLVVAAGANIGLARGWRFKTRLKFYLGIPAVGLVVLAAGALFFALVLGPSEGFAFFFTVFK